MSSVYDNWERLLEAVFLREELRYLARADSLSSSDSGTSSRSNYDLNFPSISHDGTDLVHSFTYQQILDATGGFSAGNLIKRVSSGDLFRGEFTQGKLNEKKPAPFFSGNRTPSNLFPETLVMEGRLRLPVIVKKVHWSSPVKKEPSAAELDVFSRVTHRRLVPLLGHCLENKKTMFLVYKSMPPNGDLSTVLFKKPVSDYGLQSLDWITRLKIAIGAAEGLSYLHHECSPSLAHGDVQASTILLDDKFEVQLDPWGSSTLSNVYAQEGTWSARLPRRLSKLNSPGTPDALRKNDVYCFGKVLLELVTGVLGISSSTDIASNKDWLEKNLTHISIYDKELVTNIIDPSLIIDDDFLKEVWAMAIIAKSCLNPRPSLRPLMRYVLKALENPLDVVQEDHSSSMKPPR